MRLLVFQHVAAEHPGIFREFLAEEGVDWDAVELDEGEEIPPLDPYDGLWVFGGPMDVWEEDAHPWLEPEKAAIREAVSRRGMPYLGVCLGHQLLADALGGEVKPGLTEVGILEVETTPAGERSRFLSGLPNPGVCLQWHGAEVTRPPNGARVLARSDACAVQAMSWGERAFSVQYHVECLPETVTEWAAIPAYHASLERSLGPGGAERFDAEARAHMAELNAAARRVYDNWMSVAFQ